MTTLMKSKQLAISVTMAASLVVPALGTPQGGHHGHGHGNGHGHHEHGGWDKATCYLIRPSSSMDVDAVGKLKVKTKKNGGAEVFSLKAHHLDTSAHTYYLYMEQTPSSGVFGMVDHMTAAGWQEVHLKYHTGNQECLPMGATDLTELAGRAVEVRDEAGLVCLVGVVPSADGKSKAKKAKSSLTGDGGGGWVRLKSDPKSGKHSIKVRISGQEEASAYDLFVENPATSLMDKVCFIQTGGTGKGTYKATTKSGQPLPHDVHDPAKLSGLAVEVRKASNGTLVLSGSVPSLD